MKSDVTINAPAERVWRVLTDIGAHAQSNPFLVKADGSLVVGQELL